MVTSAIFKCPANICTATLTFQQFFSEECCPAGKHAILNLNTSAKINSLGEKFSRFEKAKEEEIRAEKELAELKMEIKRAKKQIEETREHRNMMQEEMRAASLVFAGELNDPGLKTV